jgi:hypothetical protein
VLGLSLLLMTTAACRSQDSQELRDELSRESAASGLALGRRKQKECDLRAETYSL